MISIIVPIYNAENHIKKCVESILAQSYTNIELILINDGSTDNSLQICNRLREVDSRIKVIDQENSGVSKARNRGILEAKGEFIQFVDSDDFIESNMSMNMLNKLLVDNTDLVVCGFISVTQWNTKSINFEMMNYSSISSIEKNFVKLYERAFFHTIWNKMYKKSYITKLFEVGLSIGEDLKFNLNYMRNINSFATIDGCYYHYINVNPLSLSKVNHRNEIIIIENRYDDLLKFCDNYFGVENFVDFLHIKMIEDILATFQKSKTRYTNLKSYKEFRNIMKRYANNNLSKSQNTNLKIRLLNHDGFFGIWLILAYQNYYTHLKSFMKSAIIKFNKFYNRFNILK